MALAEPVFVNYARKMFQANGSDYDSLKAVFGEEFEVFCHFYYFICRPEDSEDEMRDELRFVGMTSLMEALVDKLPHSPKGYREKVRSYFKHYFAHDEEEMSPMGISLWNEGTKDFIPLTKVQEVADFLYSMRSEFVHEAQMHGLNSTKVDQTLTKVKSGYYEITLSVDDFLRRFEASFVLYWVERMKSSQHSHLL